MICNQTAGHAVGSGALRLPAAALHVCRADRHSKQHLWSQCGTVSHAGHLTAYRLRWLGQVLRMGMPGTHPGGVFALMHAAGAAHISGEECVTRDLKDLHMPTNRHNTKGVCVAWLVWLILYNLATPGQLVCLPSGHVLRSSVSATTCSSVRRCRRRARRTSPELCLIDVAWYVYCCRAA